MNINKNNYEVFFIDYYDGNLSAEKTAELFLFLESYPELKEEFNNFSNITLEIPELHFPGRESLKRGEVSVSNIDQHLIAALEGDSTFEEKQALDAFLLANPQFNKDKEIFNATVSVPDFSIVYPGKKSLKKPVPFFIAYRNEMRYGIAAMLLLAFIAGMVSVFNRTMEQKNIQVAEETPAVVPSVIPQPNNSEAETPATHDTNLPVEKLAAPENELTADNKNPAPAAVQKAVPQPVETAPLVRENTIQLANTVPANQLPVEQDNPSIATKSEPASNVSQPVAVNTATEEKYMTIWEAIRQTSEKSLQKFVAEEDAILAYADEATEANPTLVDVVSKGIEKVSNDKIKLDTDKENKRFSFSAGNFKIERK